MIEFGTAPVAAARGQARIRGSGQTPAFGPTKRFQESGSTFRLAMPEPRSLPNQKSSAEVNAVAPVDSLSTADYASEGRNFATTRWSLVLISSELDTDDQRTRQALSELCKMYWYPIFHFVSRRGYSLQDAQDLTQDFFVMILERKWLENADPARGRFRSLLLKSVSNFLNDANEKRQARKRGGAIDFVSWDKWLAEGSSEPPFSTKVMEHWSDERVFDVKWAATVVRRTLLRLQEECESEGKLRVYEILRPLLGVERDDICYADLANQLQVSDTKIKRLIHGIRQRFRTILKEEVAGTVADRTEIDAEIRYLCEVIGNTGYEVTW